MTIDQQIAKNVILIKNCKLDADYLHYISVLAKTPKIMLKNMHILRNEAY